MTLPRSAPTASSLSGSNPHRVNLEHWRGINSRNPRGTDFLHIAPYAAFGTIYGEPGLGLGALVTQPTPGPQPFSTFFSNRNRSRRGLKIRCSIFFGHFMVTFRSGQFRLWP